MDWREGTMMSDIHCYDQSGADIDTVVSLADVGLREHPEAKILILVGLHKD